MPMIFILGRNALTKEFVIGQQENASVLQGMKELRVKGLFVLTTAMNMARAGRRKYWLQRQVAHTVSHGMR